MVCATIVDTHKGVLILLHIRPTRGAVRVLARHHGHVSTPLNNLRAFSLSGDRRPEAISLFVLFLSDLLLSFLSLAITLRFLRHGLQVTSTLSLESLYLDSLFLGPWYLFLTFISTSLKKEGEDGLASPPSYVSYSVQSQ